MPVVMLLFVCMITVAIATIGFFRRMFRMRETRWELWAKQKELRYLSSALMWRLGTIKGTFADRHVRMKAAKLSAGRGFQRSPRNATMIEVSLSSDLVPLHIRRELPVDSIPLLAVPESEIGDEELDPLLRLIGADQGRYRQLLLQPMVRERILRAFESDGDLGIESGYLTLIRPGRDPLHLQGLLDEAIDVAETLEKVDGQGWRRAAVAFDLAFEKGSSNWILRCPDGFPLIRMTYISGGKKPRTELEVRLEASYDSLGIDRREETGSELSTGDPILDANISISGVSEEWVRRFCTVDGSTETVMQLVMGHGGRVAGGRIRVIREGLVGEPGDLIADSLCLLEALEKVPRDV